VNPIRQLSAVDVVRAVLTDAVTWKNVDPEKADPLAEAIVACLDAAGLLRATTSADPIVTALRQVPAGLRVSASLVAGEDNTVTGVVDVPCDTPVDVVEQLQARLGSTIEVRIAGMTIERFNAMIGKL
jgi:hypothetical protein